MDEHTRECLGGSVDRSIAEKVTAHLECLVEAGGAPMVGPGTVGGRVHHGRHQLLTEGERVMTDKLEAECPDCGSEMRFTLDDVAKQRTVRCSRGHRVNMRDEGGGARKISKALSDLDKTLKKFGK